MPDENFLVLDPEPILHDHEPVLEHDDVQQVQEVEDVVECQPVRQVLVLVLTEKEPVIKLTIKNLICLLGKFCVFPLGVKLGKILRNFLN